MAKKPDNNNNNRPGNNNNNNNNRPGNSNNNNNNRPSSGGSNNRPSGGGGSSSNNNRPSAGQGANNNNNNRPGSSNNNRPSSSNNNRPGSSNNNNNRPGSNNANKQQAAQRESNAEAWRNNPAYSQAVQDAIGKQVNSGLAVGQQFYDSPEFAAIRGELTNQQIADFAKSQGYKLGDQWQKDFGTNPAKTLQQAMKGDNEARLHALLKIAAGQGKGTDLVSKKEFNKIYNYYDGNKTGLKITNRMDAINSKQQTKPVNNRYNPMGLQSDVFGRINKGKYGDGRDLWPQTLGSSVFDKYKGPLSQLALNYKGSNLEGVKGFGVYGADAHGNAIFSPGQGGKSWSEHKLNNPTTYEPWYEAPAATTQEAGAPAVETPKKPEPEAGFSTGGAGDGGEKNALTFRQNKSRWKQDGRAYKGTSGLRFNRLSGFGGFGAAAGLSGSVF
jgi:hypothetical protein